ncbi:MAG: sensor histidine kinase [Chloroflexaceae bacterium]
MRSCLRGQSITRGLLFLARQRESRREPCELNDLVQDTITLLRPEFTRLGVIIEECLQPLPIVQCDSGQITQVLINLLTNARDAMRDQEHGRIIISTRVIEDQLELSVSDTGSGIPAEMLDTIFQPFVTTKDVNDHKNSGTGLGLTICRTIVENHGGSIHVESEVGRGTTMIVRFPLSELLACGMANCDDDRAVVAAGRNLNHADAPYSLV